MSKRLIAGALSVVLGVALATACGSSNDDGSGGAGGSSGSGGNAAGGTGGNATGGSGGNKDGGPVIDASGGAAPYADANLDAPYKLPDGGCGQVFCPAAVAAGCSKGFQSLNDCAHFCSQVAQTSCATKWDVLLTCAGPSPQLTCDSSGQIAVTGCDSEGQDFTNCLTSLADAGP